MLKHGMNTESEVLLPISWAVTNTHCPVTSGLSTALSTEQKTVYFLSQKNRDKKLCFTVQEFIKSFRKKASSDKTSPIKQLVGEGINWHGFSC